MRKERFDIDDDEVAPYLQLDKLREGMFWVAGELLGLSGLLVEAAWHHRKTYISGVVGLAAGDRWPVLLRCRVTTP